MSAGIGSVVGGSPQLRKVGDAVTVALPNLPVHNDDLEAVANNLTAGDLYRTPAGDLKVVV